MSFPGSRVHPIAFDVNVGQPVTTFRRAVSSVREGGIPRRRYPDFQGMGRGRIPRFDFFDF